MNWRTVQLGSATCDQDRKLLQLIDRRSVRIHGNHQGFDQFCNVNPQSDFCLIFFNTPAWLSEIRDRLHKYLEPPTTCVYIGINRYQIKGNDIGPCTVNSTDNHSQQILSWTQQILSTLGFKCLQQGYMEQDVGRYFNFVQPLTWIYAEHATN